MKYLQEKQFQHSLSTRPHFDSSANHRLDTIHVVVRNTRRGGLVSESRELKTVFCIYKSLPSHNSFYQRLRIDFLHSCPPLLTTTARAWGHKNELRPRAIQLLVEREAKQALIFSQIEKKPTQLHVYRP